MMKAIPAARSALLFECFGQDLGQVAGMAASAIADLLAAAGSHRNYMAIGGVGAHRWEECPFTDRL
jgi:hypothetical protein